MNTETRNFGISRILRTFKPRADSSGGHLSLNLDYFDHGLLPTLTVVVHPEAVERCGGFRRPFLLEAILDGSTIASALQELAAGYLVIKLGVSMRPVGSSPDPNRAVYAIDARGKSFVDFCRALAPRDEEREERLRRFFYA